jgi:hypothetical protein
MLRPTRAAANGIWRMYEVSENIIDTTWPIQTDPNFANVTVLIHGDDQEAYSAGPTQTGQHWRNCASGSHSVPYSTGSVWPNQASISQAVTPKFGTSAIRVSSGGVGVNSVSADFAFGTGDFTIEGWFYFTSLGPVNIVDCRATSGSNGVIPTIYCLSNAGSMRYFVSSADRITGAAGSLTVNTWTHIALSRVSGNTYLYANGAQVGSTYVDANNYTTQTLQCNFGSSAGGGGAISGHMQELRITKGVGRYSGATCTVPTTKFADTS